MRHLGMLFIVAAMGLMSCTQSIYPLFHEKDLVFDEKLLGSWGDGDDTWTFERAVSTKKRKRPANAYLVTVREGDTVELLQAHLGYIGDYAFLDLFLDRSSDKSLPLHFIYRIVVEPDSLRLGLLGDKWLDELKKAEKDKLRLDTVGGNDVSLASTATLQEILRKHYRDDPTTVQDMGALERVK